MENRLDIEAVAVGPWTRRVRLMQGDHCLAETSKDVVKALGDLDEYASASAAIVNDILALEADVARKRTFLLLGYRERTRAELRTRLADEGYSHACIEELLDDMERINALSDTRYAEICSRSKLASGWSRARVESHLRERGVSQDIARETLDELTDDSGDAERALALISGVDLSDRTARTRAIGRLARRGYTPSQAYAAIATARSRTEPSA